MEQSKTLTLPDGLRLAYRVRPAAPGARRVLVLLHGLASNLTRWSEFVEHTAVAGDWVLLRVDLRGHGASFTRGRIGMARWCQDLRHVLDAERHDAAVLVGHSLGAHLALEFAARYPARVAGLVLIDPAFKPALHGRSRQLARLRPLLWLFARLVRALNRLGLKRRAIPSRDLRALDETVRRELLQEGLSEEFVRRYSSIRTDLRYFPTAHFLQELYEMLRPLPPLESIRMPVLVLLSSGLTYTDPELTRQALATLPRLQIATIDAYHWPLTERPADVRAAIEQWLRAQFGGG